MAFVHLKVAVIGALFAAGHVIFVSASAHAAAPEFHDLTEPASGVAAAHQSTERKRQPGLKFAQSQNCSQRIAVFLRRVEHLRQHCRGEVSYGMYSNCKWRERKLREEANYLDQNCPRR